MDTNTKTLQINTFSKGMDTDTSDALLSSEAYRLANNLRYITDTDENTGELHMFEGVVDIDELYNTDWIANLGLDNLDTFLIRATTTIRNYGVLIISTSNSWYIIRLDTTKDNLDPKIVFGPCEESLGTDSSGNAWGNKLSLVTNWESDDNVKLYIADGEHLTMVINICDKKNKIYTEISSIVNGNRFPLPMPEITQIISGNLKPALIQYSYRLYNQNGLLTGVSPLTKQYKVNKTVSGIIEGLPQNSDSTIGFLIKVKAFDNFDKVQLIRTTYAQNGQLPTIEIIYDNNYTEDDYGYIQISDFGRRALLTLTQEEYNSLSGITIIPKIIEKKDGYLFAANVTYQNSKYYKQFLEWDARSFTSGDTYNELPILSIGLNNEIDIDKTVSGNQTLDIKNSNLNLLQKYDKTKWTGRSYHLGGIGTNIDYELCVKEEDEVCIDSTITESKISIPIDDSTKKGYGNILYSSDYKSLRRGEIYRYGIVLYSEDGYKFPAKWIADIRIPDINSLTETEGDQERINYFHLLDCIFYLNTSKKCAYANVLGIEFNIKNLPQGCSGYEIVRCNRSIDDRSIITQGVLSAMCPYYSVEGDDTKKEPNYNENLLFPNETVTLDPIYHSNAIYGDLQYTYLLFFSPEICYQPDDIKNYTEKANLYLLPVRVIQPYNNIKDSIFELNGEDEPDYIYVYSPAMKSSNIPHAYSIDVWESPSNNTKLYFNGHTASGFALKALGTENSKVITNITELSDRKRFSYIKLYSGQDVKYDYWNDGELNPRSQFVLDDIPVKEIAISDKIPECDSFATSDTVLLTYDKYLTQIGTRSYCPWIFPYTYRYNNATLIQLLSGGDMLYYIGISDRSAIVQIDTPDENVNSEIYNFKNSITFQYVADKQFWRESVQFKTIICNLKRNITPYNGFAYNDRANSVYYSHGEYFDKTITNPLVYDGDCFIQCFEFVPFHQWYHPTLHTSNNFTVIYSVPVETDIDIANDYGSRYSRIKDREYSTLLLDQESDFGALYSQSKPIYAYNTAYNLDSSVSMTSSINQNDEQYNKFDYRIHYSNLKTNNESIDSWSMFQPLNYIDVNTQYGCISDLRLFNNQLLFWQQQAVGLLSVNERTQITDDSNLPLILGTGGILDRYDYISTKNGMKENQFVDTQSDTTLYWWDYDNHELCAYANNLCVVLSKVKFVLNFINKQTRLNNLSDTPLLMFDKKYNEIICHITDGIDKEAGSLVYNEMLQLFTSLYTIDPQYSMEFFDRLFLLKNNPESTPFVALMDDVPFDRGSCGFNRLKLYPYIKYVINDNSTYTKVYDNVEFAGTIYNGGNIPTKLSKEVGTLSNEVEFDFHTPLNQNAKILGNEITNRQYEFRFAIPRCGDWDNPNSENRKWITKEYGDRLRGKTMQCEMSSTSNSLDFSLQYIITKYRISWS